MIGAGAGIAAAFIAVHRAQHAADRRDLKTLRALLAEFDARAVELEQNPLLNPPRAVDAALVHYRATRDAAIGMRTRGASAAKVAAELETNQVGDRLQGYHNDGVNVQGPAVQAFAPEVRELGQQLLAVLTNGL